MKYLLIIGVVLAVVWLWRSSRPSGLPPKQDKKPGAAPLPLEMVRCTLCSVHLPLADTVQGKKGLYCCTDHLHRAEP